MVLRHEQVVKVLLGRNNGMQVVKSRPIGEMVLDQLTDNGNRVSRLQVKFASNAWQCRLWNVGPCVLWINLVVDFDLGVGDLCRNGSIEGTIAKSLVFDRSSSCNKQRFQLYTTYHVCLLYTMLSLSWRIPMRSVLVWWRVKSSAPETEAWGWWRGVYSKEVQGRLLNQSWRIKSSAFNVSPTTMCLETKSITTMALCQITILLLPECLHHQKPLLASIMNVSSRHHPIWIKADALVIVGFSLLTCSHCHGYQTKKTSQHHSTWKDS